MLHPQLLRVRDYRKAKTWFAENDITHIFKNYNSFYRFLNKHREELVRSGQLLIRAKKTGYYIGPSIDEAIEIIIIREAKESIGLE